MKFREACDFLERYLSGSDMNQESGIMFRRTRRYSEEEIKAFEERHGISLPESYRYFLMNVGSCECYAQRGAAVVFFELEKIESFTKEVFGVQETSFPRLFIVVTSYFNGDFAGFDLDREDHENFSALMPDIPPENWLDEDVWFGISFEKWLVLFIENNGNSLIP